MCVWPLIRRLRTPVHTTQQYVRYSFGSEIPKPCLHGIEYTSWFISSLVISFVVLWFQSLKLMYCESCTKPMGDITGIGEMPAQKDLFGILIRLL